MKKLVRIEGMSCGHCTARVESALKTLPNVTGVEVELDRALATVTTSGPVSEELIQSAVYDAGFDVTAVEETI